MWKQVASHLIFIEVKEPLCLDKYCLLWQGKESRDVEVILGYILR